jgi:hypothetical protein
MKNKSVAQLINAVNGITLLAEYSYPEEMHPAWKKIASHATPCKRIPFDNDFLWSNLVNHWNQLFVDLKLINESGELLISVGGFAGSGVWQKVKCDNPAELLNISIVENEPELIVMDVDRKMFIAITCEENEFLLFVVNNNGWRFQVITAI